MKNFFLCLVFVFIGFSGRCRGMMVQATEKDPLTKDSRAEVNPIEFDKDQLEGYKKDKAFNYDEEKAVVEWWVAFKRWFSHLWNSFWEWIFGPWTAGSWLSVFLSFLKYLVIAGVVALVIWLFMRLNPGQLFLKEGETGSVWLSEEEKILQSDHIEKWIKEALSKKDYRSAIRYSFLLALKNLKENGFIDYAPDKTNAEYLYELQKTNFRLPFQRLAHYYEYSWYGDFEVNERHYKKAVAELEELNLNPKV